MKRGEFYTAEGCTITELANTPDEIAELPAREVAEDLKFRAICTPRFQQQNYEDVEKP